MIKLSPVEGAKYFYNHDQAVYVKRKSSTDYYKVVPYGTPVLNLRLDEDFYYFQLQGDDEQYVSFYGWAFALDTPKNRARWNKYRESRALLERMTEVMKRDYECVQTLKDKSSSPNNDIRVES